jgi:hypothetical protein
MVATVMLRSLTCYLLQMEALAALSRDMEQGGKDDDDEVFPLIQTSHITFCFC